LFTINNLTNLNAEELYSEVKGKVDISICYVDEFDNDYIKNLISEDMTSEEVDEILNKFRYEKKEYYSQKGKDIVLKIELSKISSNYTIFESFPSIGLTFNSIDYEKFETILKICNYSEITEIQFYGY
jgi:hypothetical protein